MRLLFLLTFAWALLLAPICVQCTQVIISDCLKTARDTVPAQGSQGMDFDITGQIYYLCPTYIATYKNGDEIIVWDKSILSVASFELTNLVIDKTRGIVYAAGFNYDNDDVYIINATLSSPLRNSIQTSLTQLQSVHSLAINSTSGDLVIGGNAEHNTFTSSIIMRDSSVTDYIGSASRINHQSIALSLDTKVFYASTDDGIIAVQNGVESLFYPSITPAINIRVNPITGTLYAIYSNRIIYFVGKDMRILVDSRQCSEYTSVSFSADGQLTYVACGNSAESTPTVNALIISANSSTITQKSMIAVYNRYYLFGDDGIHKGLLYASTGSYILNLTSSYAKAITSYRPNPYASDYAIVSSTAAATTASASTVPAKRCLERLMY